jgi:starch-binding outer membrane protein, SusD/RagB family
MKKRLIKILGVTVVLVTTFSACTKKLDVVQQNSLTADQLNSVSAYKQFLAKTYSAFALTGGDGPGSSDVAGIDAGTADFFRLYWKAQELSTDEAVVAWGDPGIQDFHLMNWGSDNPMTRGLYYRCLYQINLANEFIRQSNPTEVAARGITGAGADSIKAYALEARFLRAYQYSILMDLFGNPPFTTEASSIGAGLPPQITRANLFNYIETELKAIESGLPNARTNEYGRVDKAACQALLARIYLNAEVYTGTAKWADAVTYSKRVIDAGYGLTTNYRWLLLADNHLNTTENIFTINYDGLRTQTFGGTTFVKNAAIGGDMNAADYGAGGGWAGLRTTRNLVNFFPDVNGNTDRRAMFFTTGQNLEIASLTNFRDGFAITKFRNVTRTGALGSDLTFADIDMPIFRLAEQYLIYAEATLRGGTGGDATLALSYMNLLRTRAYGNASGNITSGALNLNYIIEERARELYWEGFRRTDLIRFNRFVEGTYLWPWKGGARDGASVAAFRRLYPIPSSDINANPNLRQNTGY